jgi:hypothetical protein
MFSPPSKLCGASSWRIGTDEPSITHHPASLHSRASHQLCPVLPSSRPHVNLMPASTVLGADDAVPKIGDFRFGRIAPDFDHGGVSAGIVQAECD